VTLPRIIRQIPQPSSGSGPKAEAEAKEKLLPGRQITARQEVGFVSNTRFGDSKTFTVLMGDGGPVPTGGWAKISQIERPLQLSYTVATGWDARVVTVPILFDSVMETKNRPNIEVDIQTLEGMAGRSTEPTGGEPPYVEVYSVDGSGKMTPLVPKAFQGTEGEPQLWFITNIEFDETETIRDSAGARLRQAVVVTLTEIISTPGVREANLAAKASVKGKFKTVYSDKGSDTLIKVAKREGLVKDWHAILKANPRISSGEKHLKDHTKIKIPLELERKVPR
jgi:hypothetical protein